MPLTDMLSAHRGKGRGNGGAETVVYAVLLAVCNAFQGGGDNSHRTALVSARDERDKPRHCNFIRDRKVRGDRCKIVRSHAFHIYTEAGKHWGSSMTV